MSEWREICHYLLHHDDCKELHKLVWPSAGVAHVTIGRRYRIDSGNSLVEVQQLIARLRQTQAFEDEVDKSVKGWQYKKRKTKNYFNGQETYGE